MNKNQLQENGHKSNLNKLKQNEYKLKFRLDN